MRVRVSLPALLAPLLFAGLSSAAHCAGLLLVTEEEVAREARYAATVDDRLQPRSGAALGAPVIEVRSPTTPSALKAPFPIRVVFKASDGAEVLPSTFRVYYGLLKLDITDRVLKRAQLGKDGAAIEDANIPPGSHKLLLQIRDNRDRLGEMVLTFTVTR